MPRKILIANRGEIACRIARTARRMDIGTVSVHSEADKDALHVQNTDETVCIGGTHARDSYLNIDSILDAARQTGADAIHPGYGFLSENGEFARRCGEAGLVFIGPPPSAIQTMGSKSRAKALMERADVPLVPGYHGDDQAPQRLEREADRIGYPLLIKASAGGGGKGMRRVDDADAFEAALQSCKREAEKAFGNDHVLLEKYIQHPRHIEIQIFADAHDNFVHLFERDCSVQRRHQKVIEEAPAPGMIAERRLAMGAAAIRAAKAVGYIGAGTVEFIVEPDGNFYFMEMNTRLQVEHPVTEMITGVDLVEWQIRVARGEGLPLAQEQLGIRGHAIEARIYAENPAKHFFPSTGPLNVLKLPDDVQGVRVDSGVQQGDVVSPYYDPMLAKLIAWGEDRNEAIDRLIRGLQACRIEGIHSNVGFLTRLAECPSFRHANLDTNLIERERAFLFAPVESATQHPR